MNHILHSPISVLHVGLALLSVVTGTGLLLAPKGTQGHRHIGYVYTLCMVGVNATAFQLYYLFGHFGIVHVGAVVSLLVLTLGMGAAWLRPVNWLLWHYRLMGASVTGLYAAGLVESTYRLFPAGFFWPISLGVPALVFTLGAWLIRRFSRPLSQRDTLRMSSRQRPHYSAQRFQQRRVGNGAVGAQFSVDRRNGQFSGVRNLSPEGRQREE